MSELKVETIKPAFGNKVTVSPGFLVTDSLQVSKFEITTQGTVAIMGPLYVGTSISKSAGTAGQLLVSQGAGSPPAWGLGFPVGGIIMWSGTAALVPAGWAICNGQNGTPNLTDKFVVGAGLSYTVGDKGGSNTVTLTASQVPTSITNLTNHKHKYGAFCSVYTGTTTPTPYMSSATSTAGATIISVQNGGELQEKHAGGGEYQDSGSMVATTGTAVDSSGNPMPTIGSGDQPHENRPPYYALYYIMKVS